MLELVLYVALQCERLGLGEIDTGVIEVLAVIDTDGNETAGLGMRFIAGPLEHRDSAQVGRVRVGFRDLPGILRGGGQSEDEQERGSPP